MGLKSRTSISFCVGKLKPTSMVQYQRSNCTLRAEPGLTIQVPKSSPMPFPVILLSE